MKKDKLLFIYQYVGLVFFITFYSFMIFICLLLIGFGVLSLILEPKVFMNLMTNTTFFFKGFQLYIFVFYAFGAITAITKLIFDELKLSRQQMHEVIKNRRSSDNKTL